MPLPSTDPKTEYWYTDGSGANDRGVNGAGIYGPRNDHEWW